MEPEAADSRSRRVVGRDADLALLEQFLVVSATTGDTLLLHGEAGVGKSVLLGHAAEAATRSGTRVLPAAGVHSELDLSFAGLGHMLLPVMGELNRIGQADRNALRTALGYLEICHVTPADVLNAVSALLRHLCAVRPVLLVVDDLQWMDRASAEVLGTLAHRGLPKVGVLIARRTGARTFFDTTGLCQHEVQPLPDALARQLVRGRHPLIADNVLSRVLSQADGNPLALLELPSALSAEQRSGQSQLPEELPLSRRVQGLFAARILTLSAATRESLLLAALDASARPTMNLLTAGQSLRAAQSAGLIAVEPSGRVAFRHPLVRSTVIELSTSAERRQAHRALAARAPLDEEQSAWHLAAAAVDPDETIAALLERAAARTLRRGDASGAIRTLIRAADLSPHPSQRARRLAEAAYVGADVAGEIGRATKLLADAQRADPASDNNLQAAVTASYVLLNGTGDIETAHRLLVAALEESAVSAHVDRGTFAEAVHNLFEVCLYGTRSELWPPLHSAATRVAQDDSIVLRLWLDLLADPVRTATQALPRLERELAALEHETDHRRIERVATAAIYVDRVENARPALLRVIADARDGGAVTAGIMAMMLLAVEGFKTGHWDESEEWAAEGLDLCTNLGYHLLSWPLKFAQVLLAAARGDSERTMRLCRAMVSWGVPRHVGTVQNYAWHAQALLALGRGDFEEAFQTVSKINAPGQFAPHVGHAVWVVMDLVEAAVHAGHVDEATHHVAAMRQAGIARLSTRAALLVAGAEAIASPALDRTLFEAALALPEADRWPFDLARIQLCFGQRLRRTRFPTEARKHLAQALGTFESLGALTWAKRTEAELLATSHTKNRRDQSGSAGLTPQERSTATLAAGGMTNKQIAEHLLISPRTVGAHLNHVYLKLGISTRAALSDALQRIHEDPA